MLQCSNHIKGKRQIAIVVNHLQDSWRNSNLLIFIYILPARIGAFSKHKLSSYASLNDYKFFWAIVMKAVGEKHLD